MNDRSLVMLMTNGIGVHLTNDEKRAHLIDEPRSSRSGLRLVFTEGFDTHDLKEGKALLDALNA